MSAPVAHSFRSNARAVLVLGLPLIGSHMAQFSLHVTDTIMLGWYGVNDLAAGALGATVFFTFFTLGAGYANAVMPLVATAAAGDHDTEVRRATRMGMWLSLGYAAVVLPIFFFAEAILAQMGQEPQIADLGGQYLRIVGLGVAPALLVMVLKSYLAALGRTQVVLWVTVSAVFVNAGLNWVFIFGNLGVPEMGARGAAIASVLVQLFTLAVMLAYAAWLPALRRYTLLTRFWRPDWQAMRQVNALGLPIGLAMLAETGLFAASAVMMGWLGAQTLAAHSIALEITAMFFMIHMGLSNAATVMVGRARGRGDMEGLRAAARAAVILSMLVAVTTMLIYFIFGELMVGVFLPLLEAGMQMTREGKTSQSAAIVIFSSALVNPVFGWSLTVLLDNLGLIGDKERGQSLSHLHRWVIPTIVFIVLCAVMLGIGMFPGIPAMLESFRIDL